MTQQPNRRNSAQYEQERVERAYHQSAGKRRKKSAAAQRRNGIIAICAAVLTLICVIVFGFILFRDTDDGLILKGVKVAGINLGGMTKKEAIEVLESQVGDSYSQNIMTVKVLEESTLITPADSGAKLDVEAAVDAAYAIGRTGSASQKSKDKRTASRTGIVVDIIPCLNLDEPMIRKILENLGENYSSTLTDSSVHVERDENDIPQTLIINVGTPEYSLNLEVLYQQVLNAYRTNTFHVEGKCEIRQPTAIDIDALHTQYTRNPVNGYLDPITYEVVDPVPGYTFDLNDAKARLDSAKPGDPPIEIPFTSTPAEKYRDYPDKLAEVTLTQADSDASRNQNLKRGCSLISGKVLKPGEKFSYNDALGERTIENGYAMGPSYANGQTVYTIGGGICQVSSALYQCCLYADLKIDVRAPHGFLPVYAQGGQDAMVNWDPRQDFIFTNTTGAPILIQATTIDGAVTVRIYGTDDKTYTVELETVVLAEKEIAVTYEHLPEDNEWGYKDGDVIDPGYAQGSYTLKLIMVDKDTGKRTTRTVNTSHYNGRAKIVCKIIPSGHPGSGGGIEEA